MRNKCVKSALIGYLTKWNVALRCSVKPDQIDAIIDHIILRLENSGVIDKLISAVRCGDCTMGRDKKKLHDEPL